MIELNYAYSILWIAAMLTYLLGDVIRIFSGNFKTGEMDGKPVSNKMWLVAAIIMTIPIIMVVVSAFLPIGWLNSLLNLIIASGFILFNLAGIKGYKAFDVFLLIISFGFNFFTIVLAVMHVFFSIGWPT